MKIVSDIYRDGNLWRYATWIDDVYDCSGTLPVDDDATEKEAEAAVRGLFADEDHMVIRVDDIETGAVEADA